MELVERSMSLVVLLVLGLMVNQLPAVEASRIPANLAQFPAVGASRSPYEACNRPCPYIHSPVCGTDGLTYGNDCALEIAACRHRVLAGVEHPEADIRVLHEGRCSGGGCIEGHQKPAEDGCNTCYCTGGSYGCTEIYCPGQDVSSCVDGSSFNDGCNDCLCYNGNAVCTQQDCIEFPIMPNECLLVCPLAYIFVCGTDELTYDNACVLGIAACQHPEADIRVQHEGRCDSECNRPCPLAYIFVCGTDGLTYDNACVLDIAACQHPEADIRVQHEGRCDSAADPAFPGIVAGASVRSDGRCGPGFLAPNGRMVECNQNNNGNCCTKAGYCGGWNCQAELN